VVDSRRSTVTRAFVPVVLGSVLIAAGLAGWEAFAPHTHSAEELAAAHEDDSVGEFLVVLGIIGVAALVVFGLVVRRGLRKESAAYTALALSVLGFLAIAAFWSGLPPVLAGGGILLGWFSLDAVRARWAAWTAIAVGVVALVGDVAVYLTDAS
jgi:hypothetical protein